jgi:hypothetical protein
LQFFLLVEWRLVPALRRRQSGGYAVATGTAGGAGTRRNGRAGPQEWSARCVNHGYSKLSSTRMAMCYSKKKNGNGKREGDCHDQRDGPRAPGRTSWASKENSTQEAQPPVPGIVRRKEDHLPSSIPSRRNQALISTAAGVLPASGACSADGFVA